MAKSASAASADKSCVECELPVFVGERKIVGKRSCHLGCREKMADADGAGRGEQVVPELGRASMLERSVSDEEKASAIYTTALDATPAKDYATPAVASAYASARSRFMQGLVGPPEYDSDANEVQVDRDKVRRRGPSRGEHATELAISDLDSDAATTESPRLSVSVNNSDASDATRVKDEKDDFTKDDLRGRDGDDSSEVIVISDESKSHISISDDSNLIGAESKDGEEQSVEIVEVRDNYKVDKNKTEDEDKKEEAEAEVPEKPVIPLDEDTTNPFDDEDEEEEDPAASKRPEVKEKPKSLNPFSDDEDDQDGEEVGKKVGVVTTYQTPDYCKKPQPPPRISLNPFSSDEDEEEEVGADASKDKPLRKIIYKCDKTEYSGKNPFSSDEDDEEALDRSTDVKPLKKVIPRLSGCVLTTGSTGDTPENLKRLLYTRESLPASYIAAYNSRTSKQSPRVSLNPFSSDEDDDESSPAATAHGSMGSVAQARSSFGSTNSLVSSASSGVNAQATYRKKKQAPKPPIPVFHIGGSTGSSPPASIASSPSTSVQHSPKPRKSKRAPPPPKLAETSTPSPALAPVPKLSYQASPIKSACTDASSLDYEKEKVAKDEANRQTQTQHKVETGTGVDPETQSEHYSLPANYKSSYGKWKRKKGQAPGLPVPQKRTIKALPMTELKKELDIIEVQLQGLNKQGERLEKIIRDQCEGPDADPNSTEIPSEAEELILQLFEVVNEKNELCRRQAELMYMKRQHRLEEEQADIEYQVRCLMLQSSKSDSEKLRETELIERLVEVVNLRAEIVECLEMDRIRGVEEDDSISYSMHTYALRDEAGAASPPSSADASPKKEKKKKFRKLLKFKRLAGSKVDADKDVDESESPKSSKSERKKRNKK